MDNNHQICRELADLPHVYEAAITLIINHGWEALHGGANAGPSWTALHWAALEGRADVCSLLLKHNADPNHKDEEGLTALDYALDNGQETAAIILSSARDSRTTRLSRCVESLQSLQSSFEKRPSMAILPDDVYGGDRFSPLGPRGRDEDAYGPRAAEAQRYAGRPHDFMVGSAVCTPKIPWSTDEQ